MHIDRSSGKKNEPMRIVMSKKKLNIEDKQTRATTKTEKLMIPNETSFNSKVKFNQNLIIVTESESKDYPQNRSTSFGDLKG